MKRKGDIQKLQWQEARSCLAAVNPVITALIDKLDPGKDLHLVKATYPFGVNFVENGTLMLPNKQGEIVPIHDPSIDPAIRKDLEYSSIPFGIMLNSTSEVFVKIDNRIIPLHIFSPGSTFGLWEVYDSAQIAFSQRMWSIAVGVRSLFMLPKISDTLNHTKLLRDFQLRRFPPPKLLSDQFHIFSEIANSSNVENNWQSDILFFSGKWFTEKSDDINWLKLHYSLLKSTWDQSIYWRNKVTFRLLEQAIASAQETKNLKASPFLIDTLMQLILIGIGSSPGFGPVINDESYGPISIIQKAYTEHYNLKSYIPTLMAPQYLTADHPVYYSLQLPTMLGSSPKPKSQHTVVDDQRTLKLLVEILETKLQADNTPLYNLIKNVKFDFFHMEADPGNGIYSTSKMVIADPRLSFSTTEDRVFCESSPFLRGCIRISESS